MLKKLSCWLIIMMPLISLAQTKTYNGTVKDIATLLPVELVSISVENSNLGTVSNEEGLFRITLPEDLKVLKFSHLSYNEFTYTIDPAKETFEIYLEPKAFVLDELVISNVPLDEVLAELMKNSKKRLEKSLLLNTYYRELNNINGKYTTFSDGMLDYYVKKQNGKSDLHVNQSRAFRINDAEMFNKQKNGGTIGFDVRKAISAAYNFNMVKEVMDKDEYDYQLRTKTDKNGNSIQIIKIDPKEGVERDLFEGTVTYDGKSKLILEIDIHKAPSHAQYSKLINMLILKAKINDIVKKASFRIDGDKYVMVYSKIMLDAYVKMGKKFNDSFKCMSDVYVMDYKEGEFELDKAKQYDKSSLYLAGNNFTTEFWKTNNIMLLSESEEKIIQSLDAKSDVTTTP
jgi:hypothetical protein